ncbi:Ion channel [Loktanella fryxellensis]|uniref:Ion channel n=1 Tax=Loktanella fryxellensis TaxID=245187 RepID=A0A1H8B0Q8_9RHOB|nr:ion channel [Loktanella fryxellensis]SEM75789.1 Ion channel [Loktanella fryxellensis]
MLIQIAFGSVLVLTSILIAGVSYWAMEAALVRLRPWLARRPHPPKLVFVLCMTAVWVLAQMTLGVWIWALALRGLHIFATLEEAVYFALVAFTTLGFGDVLLPMEWRLLAGMAATNGLLNIGLTTALMLDSLRAIRAGQQGALTGAGP